MKIQAIMIEGGFQVKIIFAEVDQEKLSYYLTIMKSYGVGLSLILKAI
jgi:hypothetical protein